MDEREDIARRLWQASADAQLEHNVHVEPWDELDFADLAGWSAAAGVAIELSAKPEVDCYVHPSTGRIVGGTVTSIESEIESQRAMQEWPPVPTVVTPRTSDDVLTSGVALVDDAIRGLLVPEQLLREFKRGDDVVYRNPPAREEHGTVTSASPRCVFVCFGEPGSTPQGTDPAHLVHVQGCKRCGSTKRLAECPKRETPGPCEQ